MKTLKNMFPIRTPRYIMLISISLFLLNSTLFASVKSEAEGERLSEDIVFENSVSEPIILIEEWMIAPFANSLPEPALMVEQWMAAPFDNTYSEPELIVEYWMGSPFEDKAAEPYLIVQELLNSAF